MRKFDAENEIFELVASFENASISRDTWKHAEHLTVALYYLCNYNIDVATEKMRSGLFKLLTKGFCVDLSKEMPYHETLTIFWMRTVADFNAAKNGTSFLHKVNDLVATYDKDYPLRFYSREYLFSDKARAVFVEPDIESID